jgi:hypothetical protein
MSLKEILAKIAPTLGAALGGPLGGAAGTVVSRILLGKEKSAEAEMENAIYNATPEQILALKKADQEFAAQMQQLEIDVFKLEVTDRASARQMYAVNYWPQIILSAIFVLGYFGVLIPILFGKVAASVTPEWQGVLNTILGVLTASVPTILAFWFGSSFGSREKTAALAASKPSDTP